MAEAMATAFSSEKPGTSAWLMYFLGFSWFSGRVTLAFVIDASTVVIEQTFQDFQMITPRHRIVVNSLFLAAIDTFKILLVHGFMVDSAVSGVSPVAG